VFGFLAELPDAVSPSVSGHARVKGQFCRTPIGANASFRRIAMG
jgi:hypothetical protein